MIKNIYDKEDNYYKHEYFCDDCFCEITYGYIFRSEKAIEKNKFDLCNFCKEKWDNNGS